MKESERSSAYSWLINLLRKYKGGLTLREINREWMSNDDLSEGKEIPRATFKRWKNEILTERKIDIVCVKDNGYRYKIASQMDNGFEDLYDWIMDSVALGRTLEKCSNLRDRILVDQIPSDRYLDSVVTAMKKNLMIELSYNDYTRGTFEEVIVAPYGMKTYHNRWYVLGRRKDGEMKVYGLDRAEAVKITKEKFKFDPTFDVESAFSEYYGVRLDKDVALETVVIRAHGFEKEIYQRQKIHHSQRMVDKGKDYADFELRLRPTFDFVSYLESRGRFVEILQPQWLREELVRVHREAIERNS